MLSGNCQALDEQSGDTSDLHCPPAGTAQVPAFRLSCAYSKGGRKGRIRTAAGTAEISSPPTCLFFFFFLFFHFPARK